MGARGRRANRAGQIGVQAAAAGGQRAAQAAAAGGQRAAQAAAAANRRAVAAAIRPGDVLVEGWKCTTCSLRGKYKRSFIEGHEGPCRILARRADDDRVRAAQEAARLAAAAKGKGAKRWAARDRRYGGK